MTPIDWTVVGLYFLILVGIVWWLSLEINTSSDYFLAGSGALVFETLLPTTFGAPENAFWIGASSPVMLTGLYTVFGGLRAVVYTEVLQTGLLLIGSIFITIFGLYQLGGWGELQSALAQDPERFALWRSNDAPTFPWLGVMIASPIIGVWYWCTDQYIVQLTLAARSCDARTACRESGGGVSRLGFRRRACAGSGGLSLL